MPTSEKGTRTPPPFLMLAALVFWGWQSGLLVYGVVMGVVLESSRFIKGRFEFSTADFRRIWSFCGLLGFAMALYAFGSDEETGGIGNLLHGSDTGHNAMVSGVHAAAIVPRWLPIIFFLLTAAQNYSEGESIPLSAISIIFRRRQRNAAGAIPEKYVNIGYSYLMVCLFSAGIHTNEGSETYFWGLCVLVAWALWPLRSRRFHGAVWLGTLVLALALAYLGDWGVRELEQLEQGFSAKWMAHLMRQRTDPMHTMTAIGQIGELKLSGAIAIRLQTRPGASPPTYLHEASYFRYNSQAWFAGGAENEFQYVPSASNSGNDYNLLQSPTGSNVVNIACYLDGRANDLPAPEGLLPLPTACGRLENAPASVARIRENRTGAVLAAGPRLMVFDARYGGTQTIDAPPETNWDLSVPTNEVPALRQSIAEMNISGTGDEAKEQAVAHFFAGQFTYRTWQGPDTNSLQHGTPLGRFLLETHSGHCEYFATATVLLLRQMKIPARYAVGYYVHEASGDDHYVVRERDAHAWCLVWNAKSKTWSDFDTTPGSWVAEEGKRASVLQSLSDFFSWLHFQFAKFLLGQSQLRKYILWTVGPVLLFLLYQIIFRRGRRRRAAKSAQAFTVDLIRPGLDSEFYLLERELAARGVPRQPGESLGDWLERLLAEQSLAGLREPMQKLLQLHYRHRFDPNGLREDERKLLAQKAGALLQKLAKK